VITTHSVTDNFLKLVSLKTINTLPGYLQMTQNHSVGYDKTFHKVRKGDRVLEEVKQKKKHLKINVDFTANQYELCSFAATVRSSSMSINQTVFSKNAKLNLPAAKSAPCCVHPTQPFQTRCWICSKGSLSPPRACFSAKEQCGFWSCFLRSFSICVSSLQRCIRKVRPLWRGARIGR